MSIRIFAATIVAAAALTTVVALEDAPLTPNAHAASADFNPAHEVKINPTADGARYSNELKAYQLISKLRHSYHSASYDQKYDVYPAPAAIRTAADLSEWACYIAKARVALTILKMEGNEDARALDVSKVGIDSEVSATALPILSQATQEAFRQALNDEHSAEDKKLYQNRHKLFNDGKSRLETVVEEFANNTSPTGYEYDAFSVTDWGVAKQYLEPTQRDMHLDEDDLKIQVIDAAQTQAITAQQAADNGDANRAIAIARFGDIDTPTPPTSTTSEPSTSPTSAAPSTTSTTSATSATETTSQSSTTSAPTPTPSDTPAEPSPQRGGLLNFLSSIFSWFKNAFNPLFRALSS